MALKRSPMRTASVEHENRHKPGRYLALQIAGKYYAIRADTLGEMMPAPEVFPWQSSIQGLLGFTYVQGVRIPVFDLQPRLDAGKRREMKMTPQTRMVVCEVHGVRTGFLADRLTDMIHARAHEIKRDTIYGHGRPKSIVQLDDLWPSSELAELAA
jgi:chemotaxis signal transduction protein